MDAIHDFFTWKYNCRNMYECITMKVLPIHPIHLSFTSETAKSGDSLIYGLVIGSPFLYDDSSNLSLYNAYFPNKLSPQYKKTSINSNWGSFEEIRYYKCPGIIQCMTTNSSDDILASFTNNSLVLINNVGKNDLTKPYDNYSILKFCPSMPNSEFYAATDKGGLFFHNIRSFKYAQCAILDRPIIDLSIDPFDSSCVLAAQGKSHFYLIDKRTNAPAAIKAARHISSVSYSPSMMFLFCMGTITGELTVHDMRMPSMSIDNFQAHESAINNIKWSPHNSDVIASTSMDTSLSIWSFRKTDNGQVPSVFTHNGHLSPISCFDWCPDVPWTLATVSEDNIFEIFTISKEHTDINI